MGAPAAAAAAAAVTAAAAAAVSATTLPAAEAGVPPGEVIDATALALPIAGLDLALAARPRQVGG